MTRDIVRRAALNNAIWCDAMCRAHGCMGVFTPTAWSSREAMPRFYPNLVTLGDAETATVLDQVHNLSNAGLPAGWAIKDSFCRLDLGPVGFNVQFEAHWIYRPPAVTQLDSRLPEVTWRRVETADDLEDWEQAWATDSGSDAPRIFPPALLTERDHAIIAGFHDSGIVAGCIASIAADVLGITNIFLPTEESEAFRHICIAAAMRQAPGLPLVSYESGDDLEAMRDVGFEVLAPLRVLALATS